MNVRICEKESVGEYRGKIDGAEAVHLDQRLFGPVSIPPQGSGNEQIEPRSLE